MKESMSGFGGAVRPTSIQDIDVDFVVRIQRDCPTAARMPQFCNGCWSVWRLFGPPDRRFGQLKLASARVSTGRRAFWQKKLELGLRVLGRHPRPDMSELVSFKCRSPPYFPLFPLTTHVPLCCTFPVEGSVYSATSRNPYPHLFPSNTASCILLQSILPQAPRAAAGSCYYSTRNTLRDRKRKSAAYHIRHQSPSNSSNYIFLREAH